MVDWTQVSVRVEQGIHVHPCGPCPMQWAHTCMCRACMWAPAYMLFACMCSTMANLKVLGLWALATRQLAGRMQVTCARSHMPMHVDFRRYERMMKTVRLQRRFRCLP